MNLYLGIDQSLTATALVGIDVHGGLMVKKLFDTPGAKLSGVDRLRHIQLGIQRWLEQVEDTGYDIQHICMEDYAFATKFNREAMGEVGGAVKLALRTVLPSPLRYPTIVNVQSLKKFVGAGQKKQQVLLGIYRKWGVEFTDDNLADAYALARVALSVATGHVDFEYEQQVLDKLKRHTEYQEHGASKGKESSTKRRTVVRSVRREEASG